VLIDTFGELADIYALATAVFVGGSLIPHGGQNMMQPAALGKPVFCGPHTENFEETMKLLREREGIAVVQNAQDLGDGLAGALAGSEEALAMGRRARDAIASRQGATGRHLDLLMECL
jgi:3-deoxy-D-manno-octulosonic-acid transferase